LEVLVHANLGHIPHTHAVIAIEIPDDFGVERLLAGDLPGWDDANQVVSRRFGDAWLVGARTPILMVPSLVTQGREHNLLLNPAHPEFSRIVPTPPEAVIWDERLFRK